MKQNTFRPRDMINKDVAGICGVARLADKARADHVGEIGSYKYGAASKQDAGILSFLGISAKAFQEAAVRIPNDIRLGAWVLDNCRKSEKDISVFNRKLKVWWQNKAPPNTYSKRLRELKRKEEARKRSWYAASSWNVFNLFE